MAMNSATDHGYNIDWSIKVEPELQATDETGRIYRVRRWHSSSGYFKQNYWLCEIISGPGVLPGEKFHISERRIIADAYRD